MAKSAEQIIADAKTLAAKKIARDERRDEARPKLNGQGRKPKNRQGNIVGVPAWLMQCVLNAKGNPLPNLANTMIALRSDPAVRAHTPMMKCFVLRC